MSFEVATVDWALFHSIDGTQTNSILLDSGSFTYQSNGGSLPGTITGGDYTIDGSSVNLTGGGYLGLFTYWTGSGWDGSHFNLGDNGIWFSATVPEPSSLVLAGLGLVGLVFCGRTRHRKARR